MNCYSNGSKEEILNELSKIILDRGSCPDFISNPLAPVESLEKDLQGKKFADIEDEKQRMIYGDITIFNEQSFRYYLFEIIEDCMKRKELPPLFSIFLFGLSEESMRIDNRLHMLKQNEKQIILKFLECILEYVTTSNNYDAIDLKEDYLEDIVEIIAFWKTTMGVDEDKYR